MSKILIPRSDSISAKTIVPTDFEKYFDKIIKDYVVDGFTVTGSTGTNRDVDVSSGTLRLKGMIVNNSATDTNAYTFSTDDTHYLYVQITRDGNGEPESWDYTSNTTGTLPTDSILIAKVVTSAGDVSSVDQGLTFQTMQHLHGFVGTGSEINSLSPTYEGQIAYCTQDGNGFIENTAYVRNAANSAFTPLAPIPYGDGSDGNVTISSNTTLTQDMNYYNLTVDSSYTLNTAGYIVRVLGTLTNNGTINSGNMNGQIKHGFRSGNNGGSGGNGGGSSASNGGLGGAGGLGGGVTIVYARTLNNAGNINANGTAGAGGGGTSGRIGAGGGGGGGSGGTAFVAYRNLTALGTVSASGGAGGAKGNAGSNPTPSAIASGSGGSNGSDMLGEGGSGGDVNDDGTAGRLGGGGGGGGANGSSTGGHDGGAGGSGYHGRTIVVNI